MKSPASFAATNRRRRAIEVERREGMIYGTVRALVDAAAERWTVGNLGGDWPDDSLDEMRRSFGDAAEALEDELNSWRADARKYAEKIVKLRMPLTLASMEDAFWNRLPKGAPLKHHGRMPRGGPHGRVGRR